MAKLKKRKDGRYQRRVTLSSGKTRVVYGRTQAALDAAVRAVLADDSAGLDVGDRTTVGEWAKIWLQTYKADLRHATVQMYRNAYNNHVRQVLGGMELRDVRPVHIRSVMSEVAGMSESLQNKVLLTMRQIFATAIDNGLLLRNPCDKIKITPHAKPRRKEYLTAAECDTLMEAVTEPRARAFVALCLYCGLRREEALGLKWTDLGADRLVVSRAMTFGSNQQLPVEELKNTASCRMLPMPDKLRQVLATTPRLAEYVVPAANGGDMTLSAFRRLWTSHVRRQVGFELHPHMLRHPYVKPTTKKFITFFEVFRAAS